MKHPVFVRVRFPRSSRDEHLQAQLITRDPLGFLEEDDWWEVYFEENAWEEIATSLQASWQDLDAAHAPQISRFDHENWNRQWEESIQPITVSDRIVIAPSWHDVPADSGSMVLVIDPKMSFGTGYHATTRLMLRLLDGQVREGDIALDVGTGTGVLAIAAVRMGAGRADGVDTDEWSYDNALENAQRNGVENRLRLSHGSIEHANGPYDIILSNVTKIDNLQMLARFRELLAPGGRLLLSGFYDYDIQDIRPALAQLDLPVQNELVEDEWAALFAVKAP